MATCTPCIETCVASRQIWASVFQCAQEYSGLETITCEVSHHCISQAYSFVLCATSSSRLQSQLVAMQSSTSRLTVNMADCVRWAFRIINSWYLNTKMYPMTNTLGWTWDRSASRILDSHGAGDMEVAQVARTLRHVVGTAAFFWKKISLEVWVEFAARSYVHLSVWDVGPTHVVQYSTAVRKQTNKVKICHVDCDAARLKLVLVSGVYLTGTRVASRVACSCK